jgi:hypothetical protein
MIRQTGDTEEAEIDPESGRGGAVELRDETPETANDDIDPAEFCGPEEFGIRRQTISTDS